MLTHLQQGESLYCGQSITSPNRRYVAVMQHDCNFVVYEGHRPLWASNTVGNGDHITMQANGNLVIYSSGVATWASNTVTRGKYLALQDDGHLVIYDSNSRPVWASNDSIVKAESVPISSLSKGQTLKRGQSIFSPNRRYLAVLQYDCNFVVYDGHRPLWATKTVGKGDRIVMQTDGNLVIYNGEDATWASNTWKKGHYLIMQDDGNLVIYDSFKKAVWASDTAQ